MNFSRLLATGRSLIGVRNTDSPYRMRKGTLLPKFESVKNPFVAPAKAEAAPTGSVGGLAAASQTGQARAQAAKFSDRPLQTGLLFDEQVLKPVKGVEDGKVHVPRHEPHPHLTPTLSPPSEGAEREKICAPGPSVQVPRLVEVYSVKEVARMVPVPPARKETIIARVGSVEAAPEPPPVREGVGATPSAKPAKAAPVVGLMDASPLGLKTGVAPKGGAAVPAPAARPEAKSNFLAAFVKKINPLAYLPERKAEGPRMRAWQTRAVVQAELSLENVKVIRNELNDTDLEVVPARTAAKPALAGLRLQPIARSENTTLGRLTSRFFGQDQPAGSLK